MREIKSYAEMVDTEIPMRLKSMILEDIEILDEAYGDERDTMTTGGTVLLIETESDYFQLKKYGIDISEKVIAEFTDVVDGFYKILIIVGTEYNILLVMKKELKHPNVIGDDGHEL